MHVRVCLCVFTAICLERETRVLVKALRTAKAVYPVTDLWGVGVAWLRAGAAGQHSPAHPPYLLVLHVTLYYKGAQMNISRQLQ